MLWHAAEEHGWASEWKTETLKMWDWKKWFNLQHLSQTASLACWTRSFLDHTALCLLGKKHPFLLHPGYVKEPRKNSYTNSVNAAVMHSPSPVLNDSDGSPVQLLSYAQGPKMMIHPDYCCRHAALAWISLQDRDQKKKSISGNKIKQNKNQNSP